ncbi:polyprenyl synthetase family protein [Streptomyces sp. NPDC048290]|uniref:polyprenyl synthetase family protein n=1 Tax=Streptomyces sp. NPDC048290 TaxID=3155811 RepID=UPI003415963A
MVAVDDDPGVLSTLHTLRDAVADEIAWRWPGDPDGMAALHHYVMLPPGKLLRPVLLLCSALASGAPLHPVVPAAVGVEAVHVGSLLHDDIIDQDGERRNRPAAHTVFGPAKAIIAGNALYFEWFAALTECARRGVPADRVARAMRVQCTAGARVCRGAYDEITMAGWIDTPVEDYLRMAEGKTAVLIEAACRVGAVLAGAAQRTVDAVGAFGHHLGVAFQLRDDLLPYDTTPDASGKPPVSDLRNRRPTLPVLLAYRSAGRADRESIRRTLLDPADPSAALTAMHALVTRLGALDEARAMVTREADRACAALARVDSPGPAYTAVLHHTARRLTTGNDQEPGRPETALGDPST